LPALGDFIIVLVTGGLYIALEFTKKNGDNNASEAVARFYGSLHRSFCIKSCYHTDKPYKFSY
jgi:hypothetical protein